MIPELKVAIEMASPGTPSLTALRIAEVVAERIREAKAEAWDEGNAVAHGYDLSYELDRQEWLEEYGSERAKNPYREA